MHRLLILSLLAGCAASAPPSAPSPAQVATDVVALAATGADPAAYYAVGVTRVRDACDAWFSNQLAMTDGAHALGGLLSTAGVAAAAEPAAAVGLSLGAAALSTVQPAFPPAAFALVGRVMDEYSMALDAMPPPVTLAEADRRVHALAARCTLPAISAYWAQAAATVPVSAEAPTIVEHTESSPAPRSRSAAVSSRLQREWDTVRVMGRAAYERSLPRLRIGP